MTKFTLNENGDINSVLFHGFRNGVANYVDIFLLAKYYIWICGYSKSKTSKAIAAFCQEHDKNFNFIRDRKMVKTAINRAYKFDIKNIKKIEITLKELSAIEKIKNFKYQKIAFIMLVIAKVKHTGKNPDYYISRDLDRDIIRLSGLKITRRVFDDIHKLLCDLGLIQPSRPGFRKYNTDKLLFVDAEGKVGIVVDDFTGDTMVIQKYLDYYGGEMLWCNGCGKLKRKYSNRQKRCRECCLDNIYCA